MAKRKLSDAEHKVCIANMENISTELDYLIFKKNRADLMLNMGLDIEYKMRRKEFEKEKADVENRIELEQRKLEVLQDQVDNGVEIKEAKEE